MNCTNQQPPQRGSAVPNPVWVGLQWLLVFPRVSVTPGTPLTQSIFSPCSPLNDRRRVARSLFKIGLFFLFCPSLARLLILLLLLMSGNVHPNPFPVFPCLVCAGNVTWRGRSVQCCTCSNWVHLKCSLLSFSRFRILGSSHSWSFPPCFFWRSHTYQHFDFPLELLQLVYLHCSIWPPSANASLAPHPRIQTSYPISTHFVSSPSAPAPPPHAPGCFSLAPASSPLDSLTALQWNVGGLRARSTELLHFLSSHPVDLICIQESYSCKQNYDTICNLLSQDSITIYTTYTEHHYI